MFADPLSLRYEAVIRDANGVEHKSAERFYWYKMAEKFEDKEAMQKILLAQNVQQAEEEMKNIKGFDATEWDKVWISGEGELWDNVWKFSLIRSIIIKYI